MNKIEIKKIEESRYILCPSCQMDSISILRYGNNKKYGEFLFCECTGCDFTFYHPKPVLNPEYVVAENTTRIHILLWDKSKGMLSQFAENELMLLKTQEVII